MKCPNCGFEAPDGTTECPKCQIILSKWAERAVNKALDSHTALREQPADEPVEKPAEETSSLTIRLFVMFLVTAGLWYLVRPSEKPPVPASAPVAEEQSGAAQPAAAQPAGQEAQQPAAPAPIKSLWKFEGKVLDLLRDKPIAGVKLVFYDPHAEESFTTETDLEGHYALDLKARVKGGYEVQISHPDYGSQWWDAKCVKLAKKQRYQLSGQVQARTAEEWARHVGKPGSVVKYDFAIFPANLSEDEQKEQSDAQSGGPARDY